MSADGTRFVGSAPAHGVNEFRSVDFEPVPIAPGMRCRVKGTRAELSVEAVIGTADRGPRSLRLVDPKGTRHTATESQLLDLRPGPTLQDHLAQFSYRGLQTVLRRERVVSARRAVQGNCRGLETLYGARVQLLEHQVSVVRAVLSFPGPRALLGDEVGLGKTVESGLIIGALLKHKPDLNVLIVCPGALATQWLAEIYSKFHGHVFYVPSLSGGNVPACSNAVRLILTMSDVSRSEVREYIDTIRWDLVVVDEAHRVPTDSGLFEFLRCLSARVDGLLLLSATPVRSRATDFVRLLSLLNPSVFGPNDVEKLESLRPKQAAIEHLFARTEGCSPFVLPMRAKSWSELLPEDSNIAEWTATMSIVGTEERQREAEVARDLLLRYVADVYRVDHRIMRNRREALRSRLSLPERTLEVSALQLSDAELRLLAMVRSWVVALAGREVPLLRRLLQAEAMQRAASSARALATLIEARLMGVCDPSLASQDLLAMAGAPHSREELDDRLDDICAGVPPSPGEQQALVALASAVTSAAKQETRVRRAAEWVIERLISHPREKVLVFVEYLETFDALLKLLAAKLKTHRIDVSAFREGMNVEDKERAAQAFLHRENCRALVSDASGGEGRNFQHADVVLHVDLPWDLGAIEQRIGRLDRIGRTNKVLVAALHPEIGVEAHWARLVWEAYGLGAGSLAGLEFLAEETQTRFREAVAAPEDDQLLELVASTRDLVVAERARLAADEERQLDVRRFDLEETKEFIQELKTDAKMSGGRPSLASEFVEWALDVGVHLAEHGAAWDIDFTHLAGSVPVGHQRLQFRGTFERWLAKKDEALQYLAWGHPFIEWLAGTVADHPACRVAAATIDGVKREWRGCRVVVCAEPDPDTLATLPVFLRGRVAFTAPPVEEVFFIGSSGEVETDQTLLATLAARLGGGSTPNASHMLADPAVHARWRAEIEACVSVALGVMREKTAKEFRDASEELRQEFAPEIATAQAISRQAGAIRFGSLDLTKYESAVAAVRDRRVSADSIIWIETRA